jgi:O-antigen ligase
LGLCGTGLGVLILAAAIGFGPKAALVAAALGVAVMVAAFVCTRPRIVLTIIVVAEFTNAAEVLQKVIPRGFYQALMALALVTVAVAFRRPAVRQRLRRPVLAPFVVVVLYLCCCLPSVVVSRTPEATSTVLENSIKDAVFLTLVLLLAQVVGDPWWLVKIIVAPLAVIATLTLVNQVFLGNATSFGGFANVSDSLGELTTTARHAGPTTDPNFWARNQILGLPFAYALCYAAWLGNRRRAVVVWTCTVLALLLGIYLTQSRGGVLAVAGVTGLWIPLAGPAVRRLALRLSPIVVLVLLAPGVGNRLLTLTWTEGSDADQSLVGRFAAQEMAWLMFRDSPTFGVGLGSFPSLVPDYAPMSPAASQTSPLVVGAPHNLYLQVLAESGIVGLAGLALLLGASVSVGVVALVRYVATPRPTPELLAERALAAAAVTAIVGWAVASLFLHASYVRELFIVFVVVGLLQRRALRIPRLDQAGAAQRWAGVLAGGRRVLVVTTGLLAAALLGGAVLLLGSEKEYVATQQWTLLPTEPTTEGYAIDVRSRSDVLPTFAALLTRNDPGITIDGSPATGLITVSARTSDPLDAKRRVEHLAESEPRTTAWPSAHLGYRVVPAGGLTTTAERVTSSATGWAAGAATAVSTAIVVAAVRRNPARRRR